MSQGFGHPILPSETDDSGMSDAMAAFGQAVTDVVPDNNAVGTQEGTESGLSGVQEGSPTDPSQGQQFQPNENQFEPQQPVDTRPQPNQYQQEPAQQQPPGVAPAPNPQEAEWQNRFAGMQGTVQELVEQNRALTAQQASQQAYFAQAQINAIEDDTDRAAAQSQFNQWAMTQQARAQEATVLSAAQQLQAREMQIHEIGKRITARELAQRFSVPMERLMHYEDPQLMEAEARNIATDRRQVRQSQAPQTNTGQAGFPRGGTAPSGTPPRAPETIDEAAAVFANLKMPS